MIFFFRIGNRIRFDSDLLLVFMILKIFYKVSSFLYLGDYLYGLVEL